MSKHKKRNGFHWITWKVSTVKKSVNEISSKVSTQTAASKLVPGPFVFGIRHVIAQPSKFVKISLQISPDFS